METARDEEWKSSLLTAHNRISELELRLYALQTILQQRVGFVAADVERRIEEMRPAWDANYQKHLAEAIDEQRREALRRLLEEHQGKPQ